MGWLFFSNIEIFVLNYPLKKGFILPSSFSTCTIFGHFSIQQRAHSNENQYLICTVKKNKIMNYGIMNLITQLYTCFKTVLY